MSSSLQPLEKLIKPPFKIANLKNKNNNGLHMLDFCSMPGSVLNKHEISQKLKEEENTMRLSL